jgi:class 3 adenylate cyclase
MFCDMVGSSELSTRLDPEEQGDVIAAFHTCCASEIMSLGGMVAQFLGDGVLAYFGYPTAHENDAERAILAGLAIIKAVAELKLTGDVAVQARIAIGSGVVVVGDLVRQGVTQENAAIGETTNLVARLQAIAEPNTLVISPVTHRLVGALFDYRDLDRHTLKGFPEPVHVRQVLGVSKVESRFEAQHQMGTSPLLGRKEELELLQRRWEQAKRGEGRVVLLIGEPGIGKSRIARALRDRLRSDPHTELGYFCSPHHQSSALYPHIGHFNRAAGIERDDDVDVKLDKLQSLLAQSSADLTEEMPLLAALLSIPGGGRYPLPEMTPQRRKERTLAALLAQMKRLAARQPILAVYEDLQWIDPSSLELMSLTIEQIREQPILLLATARPEFASSWPEHRHVSMLSLNRVGRSECESLIAGFTNGKALPHEVRDQIVTRTDGVPLFVEELTKTVLESGLLRDLGDHYELTGPLPPLAIPSTLHASLLARLDRLPNVKDVAQIAAVIGREFSYSLIAAAAVVADKDLKVALGQLVAAELIYQRGEPPEATYQFKHALVQDAAYVSLVRGRRRMLHLQVGEALERTFGAEPDLLAYHFAEAGQAARAIECHLRAADQASERGALAEMVRHLRHGLGLLNTLPETRETRRQELMLQIALGRGLIDNLGSAADAGHAAYARARDLCIELKDTERLLPVLYGLQVYHFTRAEAQIVIRYGREIQEIGHQNSDPRALILGERVLGSAYLLVGQFDECRRAYEHLIELYDAMPATAATAQTPRDDLVAGSSFLAICLTMLGLPTQGATVHERGLRHAERLQHAISLQFSLRRGCVQRMLVRDVPGVQAMAARLLVVVNNYETFLGGPEGQFFYNWALLHASNDLVMHRRMLKALDQLDEARTWALLPYLMTAAAELRLSQGDRESACALLSRAAEIAQQSDERWSRPELGRIHARVLGHDFDARVALLNTALDEAVSLGGVLWQLRIALDLARALVESGDRTRARTVLVSACEAVAEGKALPEWCEAGRLIADLV